MAGVSAAKTMLESQFLTSKSGGFAQVLKLLMEMLDYDTIIGVHGRSFSFKAFEGAHSSR